MTYDPEEDDITLAEVASVTYQQALALWRSDPNVARGVHAITLRSRTRGYQNAIRLVHPDEETFVVRIGRLDAVTLYEDGTLRLDSGGDRSRWMRERLQEFARVQLVQPEPETWYLAAPEGPMRAFRDGMRIDSRGVPLP